ncbi:MAG: diheme cytochrome c-553 [Gemmatimonadota bacterium]
MALRGGEHRARTATREDLMKTRSPLLGATALATLGALLLPVASASGQEADAARKAVIERGEYLVTIRLRCIGCHTPRIPTPEGSVRDSTRLLSGHPAEVELPEIPEGIFGPDKWLVLVPSRGTAFVGEWGVSFPRNLTPDVETGLGSWTEEIFIKALRTGKDMGEGRDILPPMPWREYAEYPDEDLRAVFAYLQSLEPIYNPVPDPISPTGERLTTMKKPKP